MYVIHQINSMISHRLISYYRLLTCLAIMVWHINFVCWQSTMDTKATYLNHCFPWLRLKIMFNIVDVENKTLIFSILLSSPQEIICFIDQWHLQFHSVYQSLLTKVKGFIVLTLSFLFVFLFKPSEKLFSKINPTQIYIQYSN